MREAQCGAKPTLLNPGVSYGCALMEGHSPVFLNGKRYDHHNPYYRAYWNDVETVRKNMDTCLEVLTDLSDRLIRASKALQGLGEVEMPKEAARLAAKASGVDLALTYVQEEIRMRKEQQQ